jgi:hypothetical protein
MARFPVGCIMEAVAQAGAQPTAGAAWTALLEHAATPTLRPLRSVQGGRKAAPEKYAAENGEAAVGGPWTSCVEQPGAVRRAGHSLPTAGLIRLLLKLSQFLALLVVQDFNLGLIELSSKLSLFCLYLDSVHIFFPLPYKLFHLPYLCRLMRLEFASSITISKSLHFL